MSRRPFWFALGLLAVGTGVGVWTAGARLPGERLQSLTILGAIVVVGLGAAGELLVRSLDEPPRNTLPTPATADLVRTPGDELDERAADGERGLLRRRARDVGAAVLARRTGQSRSEARERLESGAWTDDADAAAFLRAERPRPPLRARLDALLGGVDPDERRAERATRALLHADEGEGERSVPSKRAGGESEAGTASKRERRETTSERERPASGDADGGES